MFILLGAAIALVIGTRAARLRAVPYHPGVPRPAAVTGAHRGHQYATDLPIALVIAHMTGSALLVTGATCNKSSHSAAAVTRPSSDPTWVRLQNPATAAAPTGRSQGPSARPGSR